MTPEPLEIIMGRFLGNLRAIHDDGECGGAEGQCPYCQYQNQFASRDERLAWEAGQKAKMAESER